MEKINEDKLNSIVIDLDELKSAHLNEGYFDIFGSWIKILLGRMFNISFGPDITVKGSERDVRSFAKTLGREKRYVQAVKDHGLDNPRTYKNRALLDKAVKSFEKITSLKWPFR